MSTDAMEPDSESSSSEERRFFYRFRSIDALLGKWQELERQQIYLASPEQLNDPMEGYREVFWDGDEILWRNLIRNYVLCLISAGIQCYVMGPQDWSRPIIHPMEGPDDLPTDEYRGLARRVFSDVLAHPNVVGLTRALGSLDAPLSRDGVTCCLGMLHMHVLDRVLSAFAERGWARQVEFKDGLKTGLDEVLRLLPEVHRRGELPVDALFASVENVRRELGLISRYNYRHREDEPLKSYLLWDFPGIYLEAAVESLVHPPWYTACFAESCTSASMWGVYGSGHRGVALKFRPDRMKDDAPGLQLFHGVESPRDEARADMNIPFSKVSYVASAPRIDFFRSLGRIPMGKIQREWVIDEELGASKVVGTIGDGEWRTRHWEQMQASMTQKLPDWQHEGEYRLAWPDVLGNLRDDERRTMTYKFSSLEGVVFGMRTSPSERVAIAEVIEGKCRAEGREHFEFSEARYSSRKGGVEIVPLKLLRFNLNES